MNSTRSVLARLVVAASLILSVADARAGDAKDSADEHYDRGVTNYNLGRFRQAVTEFEQAYELTREPILLYNIAQSYRQDGNVERALFFYRRFLSLDPKTKKKAEVERRIKDLEELQQKQSEIKQKPPTDVEQNGEPPNGPASPSGAAAGVQPPVPPVVAPVVTAEERGGATASGAVPPAGEAAEGTPQQPRRLSISGGAGASVPVFSGTDLNSPVDYLLQVQSAYALSVGSVIVEAGLKVTFSSLPYDLVTAPYAGKSSRFFGVFGTGAVRHRLSSAFSVAGELGAGVVFWSGVVGGDPFTTDSVGADGTLTMPSIRVSPSLRYDHPSGLLLALAPSYGYSVAPGGMRFSSLHFLDMLLLVGYAM